jgi:trimeric autotransporter adhesin
MRAHGFARAARSFLLPSCCLILFPVLAAGQISHGIEAENHHSAEVARSGRGSVSNADLWWDGFAMPVQNGEVWAVIQEGGDLVIGGTLTQAGYASALHVARWNGTSWSAIGQGVPLYVYSFCIWNGHLIAGCFGQSNDPEPLVYEFDGTAWSPLGTMARPSASGTVNALCVHDGDLIAAGSFEYADGEVVNGIARWDGSAWHAIGSGFPSSSVLAVASFGTKLVAGGYFAPNDNIDNVLQWDGASWSPLGGGLYGGVQALATDGVNLYVGGVAIQIPGQIETRVARWNGTSWSRMSNGAYTVEALAFYNGSLVASGSGLPGSRTTRWTGTSWVSLADSLLTAPRDMVAWGSRLVTADEIGTLRGQVTNDIAVYDGASWSALFEAWAPDMRGLWSGANAATVWDGRLVIAQNPVVCGSQTAARGGDQTDFVKNSGVAAWDGAHWASVGPPGHSGFVYTVTNWNGSLIAGGAFTNFHGAIVRNVARWNGTSWEDLGGGFLPSYGVPYHLLAYGGDLVAIGEMKTTYNGNTPVNGIARWDGVAWQPFGSGFDGPSPGRPRQGVVHGSDLVVTGDFSEVGGVAAANIARWDGSAWSALGSGLDGDGYTVTVFEDDVIVGGFFTQAGGVAAAGIARWDGSSWSAMGDQWIEVYVVRTVNGRLFAAGELRLPDDSEIDAVATWNGYSWVVLGSFTYSSPFFIEPYGGDLYLGGGFGSVDGHASFGIARWQGLALLDAPAPSRPEVRLDLSAPRPNPSPGGVTLAYTISAPARVRISVFDLAGRRVARLVDGDRPAGNHETRWSGLDSRGNPSRAGVYLVRMETPYGTRESRFVRLP